MSTRLHYRLTERDGAYVAACDELVVEASGATSEAAIAALLRAARGILGTVEAVGPPSRPPVPDAIELVPQAKIVRGPDGPGDATVPEGS
jgi:hypothetical protein